MAAASRGSGVQQAICMPLTLYAHPFAAYCWKPLIALYENATPFTYRVVEDAAGWAELESLWPIKKFPLLRDGDATIVESSIIVEYLMHRYPGTARMIPENDAALTVRFMDRFFDNYVMSPTQTLVSDRIRTASERDTKGVADATKMLDVAYGWLEEQLTPRAWASGNSFSLADCSAAPALFYADWVHPIGDRFPGVLAYRERVLARPSVARVVDEARPFRKLFPQGAPNRD
jgi:glutathione S-transferase